MTIAAAILLAAATFATAAYPFFRHQRRAAAPARGSSLKELHFRRDHSYAMLKELEADYQSGTLSKEDYKKLEARYKHKAVSILRELGDLSEEKPLAEGLEDDIEKQVKSLRHKRVGGQPARPRRFCPECGAKQPPDARFCPDCGARL